MTDTSPEAVERLSVNLEEHAGWETDWQCSTASKAAAALRALAARIAELEAEVTRLREALEWYSDDPSSQGDVARAALQETPHGKA